MCCVTFVTHQYVRYKGVSFSFATTLFARPPGFGHLWASLGSIQLFGDQVPIPSAATNCGNHPKGILHVLLDADFAAHL